MLLIYRRNVLISKTHKEPCFLHVHDVRYIREGNTPYSFWGTYANYYKSGWGDEHYLLECLPYWNLNLHPSNTTGLKGGFIY